MLKPYEKISPTAWKTAYLRTFADIKYAREIFEELEENLKASISPEELKKFNESNKPELAPQYEARYKLLNKLLKESGINQFLELASGFSPRGILMTEENPSIEYVEVDLPGILSEKKKIVEKLIAKSKLRRRDNLHFEEENALETNSLLEAAHFFQQKPIAVFHEGLLRYLNFEEKAIIAKNIHSLLERFGGVWITPDISMKKIIQAEKDIYGENKTFSEKMTGINIEENLFENEEQAQKFFRGLGFTIERHSLLEILNQLVSPQRLSLSRQVVEDQISPVVVFVMRLD